MPLGQHSLPLKRVPQVVTCGGPCGPESRFGDHHGDDLLKSYHHGRNPQQRISGPSHIDVPIPFPAHPEGSPYLDATPLLVNSRVGRTLRVSR